MLAALARPLAALSLVGCLVFPLLFFWGLITLPACKNLLVAASLAWFVFATLTVTRRAPEE